MEINEISFDIQLEIFEKILMRIVENPSSRWNIKRIIDSRDRVDFAELDLKLRKLELEIIKKGGNDD